MDYSLTTPCGLCPFRNDDKRLRLSAERLAQFTLGEFVCHKTGESLETEDGHETGFIDTGKGRHCAGALIFLENVGQSHQMMRIAERLGRYDRTKLNMDAPVFRSWAEVEEQSV